MIETEDDIAVHLAALLKSDPRLGDIAALAGPLPLRRSAPGLAGFCATILAQQVSRASADAIFARLSDAVKLDDADALMAVDDETFRLVGLSRPKQKTLREVARAIHEGRLDFDRVARAPAAEAVAEMVAVHGIGVWTAECHLLFALGHEDVFPAGDLALQIAVARAFGAPERLGEKALREVALRWAPRRATAARLFWAYHHAITGREAAPGAPA